MLFSVIIPFYNRIKFLPRTLETVWQQAFTDYEIIIVDDGSTDGTAEYLESLTHRVQIVRQANKGAGAARNAGAARARGDYLAFLDSDDVWFPWTLATFAEIIQEYRLPAVISACVVEFAEEKEIATIAKSPAQAAAFADYLAASRTGYYVGSGMAVLRRPEFLIAGGFVTGHANAEDHDLALRLGTAPGFVKCLSPWTLGWRRHTASATGNCRRSYEGSRYLVEQEKLGKYPGGLVRQRERREIISRHVRPVALECLRQGLRTEAWDLYRAIISWSVRLLRWKFVLGFPLKAALGRLSLKKTVLLKAPSTVAPARVSSASGQKD